MLDWVSKTDRPCPQRIKVRKKQANSHLAVATRCHGALLHPLNLTRLCPSRSPNPAPSPLAQIPTLNPSPSPAPATLSFTWRPEWPFFFFNSFSVCNLYYNHLFSLCVLQTVNTPGQVSRSVSQFSSVAQSCPTLCNPVNCSTPGLPVHPGACS